MLVKCQLQVGIVSPPPPRPTADTRSMCSNKPAYLLWSSATRWRARATLGMPVSIWITEMEGEREGEGERGEREGGRREGGEGKTDRRTDRQTDRQTCTHTITQTHVDG